MANTYDMLKDLCYGDLLATPGYDVDFAVGTTYSLDLKSMLIVPYSLGMFGDLSGQVRQSPMFLLESIRRSSKHFVIFCQRGGIHVPPESQSYYPLLEDSIVEMQDKSSPMSNFHPKLWLIREYNRQNRDDIQLKVVIMSKNLVIDNNIDVVVSMTGKVDTENSRNSRKHKPLHDFIYALAEYTTGKQRKQIEKLADDLYRVKRFDVDESRFEYEGYEFAPFFYGKNYNDTVSFPESFQGTSVMTISPFIDYNTLKELNARVGKNGKSVLVTRGDYVTEKVFELFKKENADVWIVNDQMADNDIASVDLHAKTYMVVGPKHDDASIYLYIGSANATNAAFHKNAEMLLRLKLKRGQMVFDKFKREFLQTNDKNESLVYEQLNAPIETAEERGGTDLEKYIRELLTYDFMATVSKSEKDNLYNVAVLSKKIKDKRFGIKIYPLQMPSLSCGIDSDMAFNGIPLSKLSKFYVITGDDGENEVQDVIMIPTRGIPDSRNDEIFMGIVDTEEKFYNYISFMLCDDPEEFAMELQQAAQTTSNNGSHVGNGMPVRIYEQILRIAASNPERLVQLDDVIRIVKDKKYVDEFKQLYDTFRPLIPRLKKLL